MYTIPILVGLLLLLVALAAWFLVYSDMRKIHSGWQYSESSSDGADPTAQGAAPEPPSADADLASSDNMNTKPESEASADDGGR